MDISEIRKGLMRPGKSQAGLAAALGVNPSAVNRLLKGERALKLQEVEKVRAYLDADNYGKQPVNQDINPSQVLALPQGQDRLRVLGMAECGPDGWGLWNGDVIDTVPMPSNLAGVPKAYAVYVNGTSMSPRFKPGEIVHIHPYKPLTVGCYVLVQKKPTGPGEPPLAVIKELVRLSPSKVTLSQLEPPKTFDLRRDEIVSIHRIVGSQEA